eukprot:s780_g12.t1
MLRVWSVSGDELASASREECRLVRDVKEHLRTRYGVPVCLQQLLCDGRCLADDVEAPADLQLVRLTELHEDQQGIAGQELVETARSGNAEAVRFLLQAGLCHSVKKDWADEAGFTALHQAAEKHSEICSLLVEAGADTEYFNENDETPLILAARGGQTETVCLLMDAGANIDAQDCLCRTAVMEAAFRGHSEIVRLLLDAGADSDVGDDRLDTALIKAACQGHTEIVQMLLDSGAEKDAKNGVRATSLIRAASHGHAEIVRLLVDAGADMDVRDRDGRTALAHARHGLAQFALIVAMLGSTFEAFGGSMLEQACSRWETAYAIAHLRANEGHPLDEMVLRRLLGSAAASSVSHVYAASHQWYRILRLMDELRSAVSVSQDALASAALSASARMGSAAQAGDFLALVRRRQLRLSSESLSYAIHACASPAHWRRSLKFFGDLRSLETCTGGLGEDADVVSNLLFACVRSSQRLWGTAFQVLSGMHCGSIRPNVVCLTHVAGTCARSVRWAEALSCSFEIVSDPHVFSQLSRSVARAARWQRGLDLFRVTEEAGIFDDVRAVNIALAALAAGGRGLLALTLFRQAQCKGAELDVFTGATLTKAWDRRRSDRNVFGSSGSQWDHALAQLTALDQDGFDRSPVAFSSAASACRRAVVWDRSIVLLQEHDTYGLEPHISTRCVSILAAGRGRAWMSALSLIKEMAEARLEPDDLLYQAGGGLGSRVYFFCR